MLGVLIGLCAVLGLAIGSFLNVVIYRVPRNESDCLTAIVLPVVWGGDPGEGQRARRFLAAPQRSLS